MKYFPEESCRKQDLLFLPQEGEGRSFCFSELNRFSACYASFLYRRGIRAGDRVCLYLPNSPELVVALFGNHLLGVISVPVNPAATLEELTYIARQADISGFVSASDLDYPVKLRLRPEDVPALLELPGGEFPRNQDLEAPALLVFTSGTTARPKGVLLSHRNLRSNLRDLFQVWEWTREDRLLLALPLFHVHGLGVGLHGWVLSGCSAVILEKFEPKRVLQLLSEEGCTLFMAVPTMYRRLLEVFDPRRHRFPHLRVAITGSAAMPEELHRRCQEMLGQPLLERYGMTETLMNLSNPFRGLRKPGSVGLPLPSVQVRLRDEQGKEITQTDQPGELWVQGPNVFEGYWNDPETTREVFEGRWFRTGDLAARDRDGYYRLLGRISVDLIKSGGYRIGAREVEEVLESHPQVREVAVIGLPDTDLGERVVAFVVLQGEARAEELLEHCSHRLARYKCPREIRFVPALPKNAMGKVVKAKLLSKS